MAQALCLLPHGPNYRRDSFLAGIRASGLRLCEAVPHPEPGDIVVIWNRSTHTEPDAARFERAGGRVLVVENGYFGKTWLGRKWFAMSWHQHAGAGLWPAGGPQRWESWGVGLAPWREGAAPPLILAQRGIGAPGVASPPSWAQNALARVGGRIRQHPGARPAPVSLAADLAGCGSVVTWASSAALHALVAGVPVWYGFPQWIAACAGRPVAEYGADPRRDDAARLAAMRKISWAMWDESEVESGKAFTELLCAYSSPEKAPAAVGK